MKKKFGFALGGGGTRGFAHLGVVKALKEKGIEADVYAGTSAGSIVASLLASGKDPDESMELLKDLKLTEAATFKIPKNGFASLDKLYKRLDEILEGKTFAELKHTLYVCVANLNTGKVEYINSGNVAKAVQASSSIPIMFTPVEIDGQLYVDGGLLDNVPVKPLRNQCKKIVAVDIMPLAELRKIDGMSELMIRIFQMGISMQQENATGCDMLIKMENLSDYWLLDAQKNQEIFEIGYNYAKKLNVSKLNKKWKIFG